MAVTFRIYKDNTVMTEGDSPLYITGLEPNTDVPAGTYKATKVIDGAESAKVDIGAFKTLPRAVTGVTLAPKTTNVVAGITSSQQLTATVVPANASNKAVTYTVEPATAGLTVTNAGLLTWTAVVPAGTYTTTVKTTDGNKTDTHVLTLTAPVPTSVTVAPTESTFDARVAGSVQLTPTIFPPNAANKAVTYSVAPATAGLAVSASGLLTWTASVPEGTYTTTVKTVEGNKTATHKLLLSEGAPIVPTVVTVSPKQAKVFVDETIQLEETVLPVEAAQEGVKWVSNDNSIATVDANGLVTAHKAGTCDITVTSNRDNESDSCFVTVSKPTITGEPENLTIQLDEEGQITVEMLPQSAANEGVTWKSSNTDIAEVNNTGLVRGVGIGPTQVIATMNKGGADFVCNVTVTSNQLPIGQAKVGKSNKVR